MISVIVPIYNSEKYLVQCIDSILMQSYKNFELLLIDDGSTDESLQICNSYFDERIKVVSLKHKGVANVRNEGILRSIGKYICFIDSDDILHPDFLKSMYSILKKENVMYVECNYLSFQNKVKKSTLKGKYKMFNQEEMFYRLYSKNGVRTCMIANKLFRKKIFSNISFENKCNEDEFIIHKIISVSKKIVVLEDSLYYYRIHNCSRQRQMNMERLQILDVYEERKKYCTDKLFLHLNYMALLDEIIYLYCVYSKINCLEALNILHDKFIINYQKTYPYNPKRKMKYWLFIRFPKEIAFLMLFHGRYKYV